MTSYLKLTRKQRDTLSACLRILREDMAAVGVEIESVSVTFGEHLPTLHQDKGKSQTKAQTHDEK